MHKNIADLNVEKVEVVRFRVGDAMASRISPERIRVNKKSLFPKFVKDLTDMCKDSIKELIITLCEIPASDFSIQSDLHFNDDGGDNLPLDAAIYVSFNIDFEVTDSLVETLQKAIVELVNSIAADNLFDCYSENWASMAQKKLSDNQKEKVSEVVKFESEKFLEKHGGKQINSSVKIIIPKKETADKDSHSQSQEVISGTLHGYLEPPEKRLVEDPVRQSYVIADGYIDSELIVYFRVISQESTLVDPKFSKTKDYIAESFAQLEEVGQALNKYHESKNICSKVFKISYTIEIASKGKKNFRLNKLVKVYEEEAIKILNAGSSTQKDLF